MNKIIMAKKSESVDFVKSNAIAKILKDEKIRVAKEAKPLVKGFIECKVSEDIKESIFDTLPKKTKGANKGKLKKITVQSEQVPKAPKLDKFKNAGEVINKNRFWNFWKALAGKARAEPDARKKIEQHVAVATTLAVADAIDLIPKKKQGKNKGQVKIHTIKKANFIRDGMIFDPKTCKFDKKE